MTVCGLSSYYIINALQKKTSLMYGATFSNTNLVHSEFRTLHCACITDPLRNLLYLLRAASHMKVPLSKKEQARSQSLQLGHIYAPKVGKTTLVISFFEDM